MLHELKKILEQSMPYSNKKLQDQFDIKTVDTRYFTNVINHQGELSR